MDYNNIPAEKFRFADPNRKTGDKKFDTKAVSYAKDVFIRFCKNKSSVVAAIIIVLLILFAILVPIFGETEYSKSLTDTNYLKYGKLLPKIEFMEGTGFWDGTTKKTINEDQYYIYRVMELELGRPIIAEVHKFGYYEHDEKGELDMSTKYYDVSIDSYAALGMTTLTLTKEQFDDMKKWQNENDIQLLYPVLNYYREEPKYYITKNNIKYFLFDESPDYAKSKKDANVWYFPKANGAPLFDVNGDVEPLYALSNEKGFKVDSALYERSGYSYDSKRISGDDGSYVYAKVSGTRVPGKEDPVFSFEVRVSLYDYFHYRYGEEPCFIFGTNANGQDLFTRLAAGARFSLILAVSISAVNLFIGAMYGAVEGFYGGFVDLAMERVSDVLAGMPSMVVMSLFQLHLASVVGPVWSMVFAFILTGWIGMAARTRMQFYRFKNQEYVLSARTLGASDGRLMFKHIFPNAMGTLITGSVLSIPGVIFSESSLTYLGIVNLESSTQTSVGTLLSNGNGLLSSFPHIILFPALFISLLEISFNLFGNGLRDAFNPSLKGVED